GSTGKPKGAMNGHRGLLNRLLWMQDEYGLDATDRVLQKTPYTFDVSVWEFFWPLMTGASLVVAAAGGHRGPSYRGSVLHGKRLTTLHFVPSMLGQFLLEPRLEQLTMLRRVICSGEALAHDIQQTFLETVPCELHNLYGPAEAAIDVTAWRCRNSSDPVVPIG